MLQGPVSPGELLLPPEIDLHLNPNSSDYFDKPTPLSKSQRRQANKARANAQKEALMKARILKPLNDSQRYYMELLADPEVTQIFAVGEAGTGKTYIGARTAARRLQNGEIDKIIITRPTISTPGHALGFLPGGLKQKLAPWLVPIMDAFKCEMTANELGKHNETGKIEFVSFEHMRGRTFTNAFVILDEAQNCTLHDLKLFLTRKGENSTYIVSGDPTQVDISNSGLETILDMIEEYDLSPEIAEFDSKDVVRSRDAKEWVHAFAKRAKALG